MKKCAILSLSFFLSACASTEWKQDAAKIAEITKSEAASLVRTVEDRYRMPAVRLKKETDGAISVWLSTDHHGGMVVWFKKEADRWVEKNAGPWWE